MRILPTCCIPEDRKEHHAAVSKLEEKKETDVSFKEILKAEEKKILERG